MMRSALTVGGIAIVAIGIGVLLFFYGGSAFTSSPAAVIVPFTKLAHGTQSSVSRRTNYLIISTGQLNELWKMIDAKGKPPTVDFTKNAVAAIFAGQKPTVDYAISVLKVEDTNVRTVTVTLAKPGSNCTPKDSTTAPYEIVVFPATSLPFAHEDKVATADCVQ